MPTRNVKLTDELDRFVADRVESGKYDNASEVMRAALRSLERDERSFEAKIEKLRTAIADGLASGVTKGDAFARVRRALKLSKRVR